MTIEKGFSGRQQRIGSVYLIRCTGSDIHKIGWTTNVAQRLQQLQREVPMHTLELVDSLDGQTMRFEARLLRNFAHRRIAGEWFNLTRGDVRTIQARFSEHRVKPTADAPTPRPSPNEQTARAAARERAREAKFQEVFVSKLPPKRRSLWS